MALKSDFFRAKFNSHTSDGHVSDEFKHLYNLLRLAITYNETRAPNTADGGLLWFFMNGSTTRMYVRDLSDGTWKGPVNFT